MLKIGSQCLEEGRKSAIGFSQKEIYQKIKDENRREIMRIRESDHGKDESEDSDQEENKNEI